MESVAVTTYLDALCEAARELAETALGGALVESLGVTSGEERGHGAFVNLTFHDEAVQVGILLSPEGCQRLAKSLLGMAPEEEDLPISDVGDAMCEIVNIVAGGLKRRLDEPRRPTLGLPLFVSGSPVPGHQQEVSGRTLAIGGVPLALLLLTQTSRGGASSRNGAAHPAQPRAEKVAHE